MHAFKAFNHSDSSIVQYCTEKYMSSHHQYSSDPFRPHAQHIDQNTEISGDLCTVPGYHLILSHQELVAKPRRELHTHNSSFIITDISDVPKYQFQKLIYHATTTASTTESLKITFQGERPKKWDTTFYRRRRTFQTNNVPFIL